MSNATTERRTDYAADRESGTCRLTIGVWGDRSCPDLREHIHCRNCPVYAQGGRQLLARVPADTDTDTGAKANSNSKAEAGISASAPEPIVVASALRSMLVFRVRGEWLAIRTANAREVVEPAPVHRVPHRNDVRFLGLVNVRGELMPCADLGRLLELPNVGPPAREAERVWPRLLVLEREQRSWAFPVAEVEGIQRVQPDAVQPPPVTVELGRSAFTEGVFEGRKGPVSVIDEDTLWYALQRICR
ncbi:MAG: chemotaxis protein CheW [Gammaproteobacteria bacterium]